MTAETPMPSPPAAGQAAALGVLNVVLLLSRELVASGALDAEKFVAQLDRFVDTRTGRADSPPELLEVIKLIALALKGL